MTKYKSVFLLMLALVACQGSPDTTPPTIASSIPSTGTADVAASTKLAIVFSEAMNPASVQVNPTPATPLGTAVWNDSKTVVYSPPGGWQLGTSYTLSVEGKDVAGNALSGTKTIAFQTVPPPDNTPPTTPTGVKATVGDGEFFVDWNPNPEPDLAGYTLYFGAAADSLVPAVFVEKPTALAKITGLENGKTYFYAVDAQDTSGNHSPKSSVGTATPKDMNPPTLVSSEPASGTADLTLVPKLRFTFSEPMNTASVEIGMCLSNDPPASAACNNPSLANFGSPTWSEGDSVAEFTPSGQFQSGKTHVLVIFAKDKGGNELSGQTKVAFSLRATPDTTPPTVIGNGNTQNPELNTGTLFMDFSEAMDQKSVQDAFLSQPALGCVWSWSGNRATCQITSGLKQLTPYTITLGTGAKDTAGNTLAAPYQFSFSTGNFSPRVIKFSPSGKFGPPTNVSPTSPIILTFSEAMEQTSTQGAFEVKVGTTLIPGTFQWNADGTQMTYTPNRGYGNGVTVTWKLSTAALELGGPGRQIRLHLPAEVSSFFTTQPVICCAAKP